MRAILTLLTVTGLALVVGCAPEVEIPMKVFPVRDAALLVSNSPATFDPDVSSDGDGSLKVVATEPITVPLFETGDVDVEDNRIIYRAKIRTENVQGEVFLEMWCVFGDREFFSRALQSPLTGTNDWTVQATPFFLKAGENPDNLRLNLVLSGTGTAWIDDIEVTTIERDAE